MYLSLSLYICISCTNMHDVSNTICMIVSALCIISIGHVLSCCRIMTWIPILQVARYRLERMSRFNQILWYVYRYMTSCDRFNLVKTLSWFVLSHVVLPKTLHTSMYVYTVWCIVLSCACYTYWTYDAHGTSRIHCSCEFIVIVCCFCLNDIL